MRIACPACAATYDVPDRLIGAGRDLRCKKCGHAWHVLPGGDAAAPESARPGDGPADGTGAQPEVSGPRTAPEAGSLVPAEPSVLPPPPMRSPHLIDPPLPRPEEVPARVGPALWAAWAASILLVGVMVMALWLFRVEIVEAWPPAARLFLLVGGAAQG